MLGQIYSFPESASIMERERERQLVTDGQTIGSEILPIVEERGDTVLWHIRNNVNGLTYVREGEESYPTVDDVGSEVFATMPAKFGGTKVMSAAKINRGAKIGTFGEPIDVGAELDIMFQELTDRDFNTIEYIRWRMLCLGDVLLPKKDGTLIRVARYNPNVTNSSVAWNDRTNAKPLEDLQSLRNAKDGFGFDFGGKATAYANPVTLDHMALNNNANDLGKQRLNFGQTIRDINQINELILPGMNLPKFKSVASGYLDTNNTFQRFIPDGYVVIVGYHWSHGLNAGAFVMTSNEALLGEPGVFANADRQKVSPYLPYVDRAFNAGARIDYGRQVQILKVY
jgi:hypothetical protein